MVQSYTIPGPQGTSQQIRVGSIADVRQKALAEWIKTQKKAGVQYGQAEQPLLEAKELFAPGGGYGAGQTALIESELKKRGAEATAGMVASGMSSGSMAAGLSARLGEVGTRAKLGVEDVRTQQLANVLAGLSGLRAGYAGQLQATQDPTYAPYLGARAGMYGADVASRTGIRTTAMRTASAENIARMQIAAQRPPAQAESKFEVPKLHF